MEEAKESAVAKSTGSQDQENMLPQDAAFYRVLASKKKITKQEAEYNRQKISSFSSSPSAEIEKKKKKKSHISCVKCKFNLGDEGKCHIVRGRIDNEYGVSKFFSPKGVGMLPGDIVWEYVKNARKKLKYIEGHVIRKGAPGFQCKDCKYYLFSRNCLLIEGQFMPQMSCGYVVKIGNGTEI